MKQFLRRVAATLFVAILAGCASTQPDEPDEPDERPERADSGFGYQAGQRMPQFAIVEPIIPDQQPLARLHGGMTREQVLDMFGDPLHIDASTVRDERWDYPFGELYFRNDRLYIWFEAAD